MPSTNSTSETEPSNDETETAILDLPPSAKLVYTVLRHEGSLTQREISGESRLCPRTVRYALAKLEAAGIVTSRAHVRDARQSVYRLADSSRSD